MGLMALTGRRPAEIFFSASFSLPKKKLHYPAVIFDGQLKTRQAPGTSFEPYPIPCHRRPGRNRTPFCVSVVVRCNYGLWSFGREFPCGVQIKTRNPAGDPFKAKDEEVLNAISKFAKRLHRRHLNKGYSPESSFLPLVK